MPPASPPAAVTDPTDPTDPADAPSAVVLLVRHGETEWSRAGRHTGRTDVPLTELGRRQATHIGATLRSLEPDLALASPLSRAWDTAVLADLGPRIDAELVEWDFGDYEGLTTAEVRDRLPGWSVWTNPIPNGESVTDVGRRADRVISRVRDTGGRIVLVAHGHFLRVLAARWLDFPAAAGRHLVLDTTTLSVLGWERETPAIVRWNEPFPG